MSNRDQYPNGRLNESDKGEIELRVAADHEKQVVVIEFAFGVKWIGLTKQHALALAAMIADRAALLADPPEGMH